MTQPKRNHVIQQGAPVKRGQFGVGHLVAGRLTLHAADAEASSTIKATKLRLWLLTEPGRSGSARLGGRVQGTSLMSSKENCPVLPSGELTVWNRSLFTLDLFTVAAWVKSLQRKVRSA